MAARRVIYGVNTSFGPMCNKIISEPDIEALGLLPAVTNTVMVSLEDRMDYDEPEPFPFSARHWLGLSSDVSH